MKYSASTFLIILLVIISACTPAEKELQNTDKIDRVFHLDLIDEAGDVCASIEKTIHIQNRK